jgi:inner membrane protein
VQWLVNGLALVVFYLILLATSEHQGFQVAYGMASVVTVGLISGYIFLSTLSYRAFGTVVCSLTVLYGTLFGMLRSEAYALLTGTGLVVLALACTMWVTRRLGRSHEPVTLGPEGGYPAP